MTTTIQDLSPEWRGRLSELAQLREISLEDALILAQKTQKIWRFEETESGIEFLLEVSRDEQKITTEAAEARIDILDKPI